MAGRFTNLKYDPEAYVEEVVRSTYEFDYRIDPNYNKNCDRCYSPHGSFTQQRANSSENRIDVDSILKGLENRITKSNTKQIPKYPKTQNLVQIRDCSNVLETEYTRLTKPAYEIKGVASKDMRLDYPLHDPQCNIFQNFEINTRLQSKDNHRAVWQVPIDNGEALPNTMYRR